jgi:hypothetical protein
VTFADLHFGDRMQRAIEFSAPYWPDEVLGEAQLFFSDAEAVGLMILTISAFAVLAAVPHPLAKVVGFTLAGALIIEFGFDTVERFYTAMENLEINCKVARNEDDLKQAGKQFAEDCGRPVFDLILAAVLWKSGKHIGKVPQAVRNARLKSLANMKVAVESLPAPVVRPASYVTKAESATYLVRRMRISEYLKIMSGLIAFGKNKAYFYTLNEPMIFSKPQTKRAMDYIIVQKIPISEHIRGLLRLASNDIAGPGGIPDAVKPFPRFKSTSGMWEVVIPKAFWPEFYLGYQQGTVVILPFGGERSTGDDTFELEE